MYLNLTQLAKYTASYVANLLYVCTYRGVASMLKSIHSVHLMHMAVYNCRYVCIPMGLINV